MQVKLEGVLVDEEERITDPELLAEVMLYLVKNYFLLLFVDDLFSLVE